MKLWRIQAALLAISAFAVFSAYTAACPFCSPSTRGPTVVSDCAQAALVVLVHVDRDPTIGDGEYFTEVIIDQVVKPHEIIKDKKSFTLKRQIPKGKSQWLVFCDVFKGKVDAYRGIEVPPNSEMVKYLQGALALKDKATSERLRFAFEFLNSSDLEITTDAYRQFAIADYKDYMTIAKSLPPERIAGWLKDPKTQPFRYGLYSSLLGHCGKAEHAELLRKKIDEALKVKNSEIDGFLAGYIMLKPKEAWNFITSLLADGKEDYLVRYACVRTADFLREQRPDLVANSDLNHGVAAVLQFPDMADIGIEYLFRAKAWDRTDEVLSLHGKKTADKNFDNNFIKRSIVSFALRSPDPKAAAFVKEMRKIDSEYVDNIEENLKREGK